MKLELREKIYKTKKCYGFTLIRVTSSYSLFVNEFHTYFGNSFRGNVIVRPSESITEICIYNKNYESDYISS